jgi:cell division protein FtsL
VSVPARKVQVRPAPSYAPPSKRAPVRERAPKRAPLRFWIFAAAVVSCLVISVVALDSLLVQTDYAIRSAQMKVSQLSSDRDVLVNEVAQLSSPSRIALWARANGMVEPKAAVILKIRGSAKASASGGQGD